jgi:4-hydroxy-tetrahydrodipicolinate synthase
LPIVLYNVPGRTGCDLLPDTVARLCDVAEIVAIKEATGQVTRTQDLVRRCGDRILVLAGDDATCMPLYAVGARGVISVLANVVPDRVAACWDAALAGDLVRSMRIHYETLDLCDALFLESNPIPVKAALAMMGRVQEELRAPLFPMSDAARVKLRAAMTALGLC